MRADRAQGRVDRAAGQRGDSAIRSRSAASIATTSTTCNWRCRGRWCPRASSFGVPGRTLADGSTLPTIWTRSTSSAWPASWPPGSRRSPSPSSTASQSRAGATRPGCRLSRRARYPRFHLVRRGAGDPRVRAHLDDRGQRLRPGPGRALPARPGGAASAGRIRWRAAAADLLRRPGHGRDGRPFPGPPAGERSGGGALAAAAFEAAAARISSSFDMGGTTAKFAVIARGEPLLAHGFEVDRRYRFKKGSGLPINLPVIEMIEIGRRRLDRAHRQGMLKVGPDSAGADPGPPATAAAASGRRSPMPIWSSATSIPGSSWAARCRSTSRRRGKPSTAMWPDRWG